MKGVDRIGENRRDREEEPIHVPPPTSYSSVYLRTNRGDILILSSPLFFAQQKILQKMVHIIGEILCYIEPLVADFERGCQVLLR